MFRENQTGQHKQKMEDVEEKEKESIRPLAPSVILEASFFLLKEPTITFQPD